MTKRLLIAGFAALIGAAPAAASITYVILPAPGSMAPATVFVDENAGRGERVFVCDNVNQIVSGTCRLHKRAVR